MFRIYSDSISVQNYDATLLPIVMTGSRATGTNSDNLKRHENVGKQ